MTRLSFALFYVEEKSIKKAHGTLCMMVNKVFDSWFEHLAANRFGYTNNIYHYHSAQLVDETINLQKLKESSFSFKRNAHSVCLKRKPKQSGRPRMWKVTHDLGIESQ